MTTAQVHRFRDRVAASLGTGETVYMDPKTARKLARALNAAARDVDARTFADSTFASTEITFLNNKA